MNSFTYGFYWQKNCCILRREEVENNTTEIQSVQNQTSSKSVGEKSVFHESVVAAAPTVPILMRAP